MTYQILIGHRLYSSWSLRGWLPFAAHDIPVQVRDTLLYDAEFYDDVRAFGGASTVPVVLTPEGAALTDSLSIVWHLAEAFPDRGLLPDDPAKRAMAMNMIAEMHSGFAALRGACPMNLATAWDGFDPSDAVLGDLNRIETLWANARATSDGPFLFGAYSLADAYYAPVAIRIAGYGLPVSEATQDYVDAQLAHPAVQQWAAEGRAKDAELSQYEMNLPRLPFPVT